MMRLAFLPRLSPAVRVAAGLVSIMLTLILAADLFVGLLPDRLGAARRERTLIGQLVGTRIAAALESGHTDRLQPLLAEAIRTQPPLTAAALRRSTDGQWLAAAGTDPTTSAGADAEPSTLEHVRLAILVDGARHATLHLRFPPVLPGSPAGWLADPVARALGWIGLAGCIGFWLYLRRVLRYLDPNAAVPERVRTAFDTLSEGVLVLDAQHKLMLANRALRSLAPGGAAFAIGTPVDALDWLVAALPDAAHARPWVQVLHEGRAQLGLRLRLPGDGSGHELVLNCAPITDGRGAARGCLLTFTDVTELHQRTESLKAALEQLHVSQAEIERQNVELQRLATRDPLTGSLNRRSLMAEAEAGFARARATGGTLACVMCDIDHFKSVNDRYGHAGGDQVIQAAARTLAAGVRLGDIVGRYGGEEFCLVLPGADRAVAEQVTERLRAAVEADVGRALREHPGARVTMSFGVAELDAGVADLPALVDLADRALYRSKKEGRNRVTVWAGEPASAADPVAA